ncbi:hypothetical protein K0B96_02245 [Horticoccus luteus]|uniref:Uncharacterized protein n=1 Tax=Horticoccus luteus TaxID=2862869 RepID=A0A8F9TXQ0_9BACT|nr:hypothetical protein [Horticoccus luteus]QYM79457.1 hypothetical protein K0B96_02245 [Horticoccus luteus]
MTSRAAQAFVNSRIARYGRVDRLKIDSTNRAIEVVCSLEGEVDPVTVRVDRYELHDEGGKRFIEIKKASCSRPWLHRALEDFAPGRRFEVPGWAAAAL